MFIGACGEEEEEGFSGLLSSSVSSGPTLDGSGSDTVWNEADEFVVTVGQTGYQTAFGQIDVTLKSVHTSTDVYVLASWTDPTGTENLNKKQWSYSTTDGAWSQSGDEDRFYLMFDAGDNGTEGADCATMCHASEMKTTGGGHVDVWHWKAARTNPIGLADDKWWDGNGRGDDQTSVDAYNDNKSASGNFPKYAGDIVDGHFIIIPVGGSTADLAPFDSTDTNLQSNTYPGYYLDANATSSGDSRHDVKASGTYSGGVWTVELKRALNTGNADDVKFTAGSTTDFSIAVTDNSGGDHSGAGVFELKIE